MFGTNIRAIVPELAMSAGSIIACACQEIVMGKHSSLGPIDPQLGKLPARGIVEAFQCAFTEIKTVPAKTAVWQPIIAKYDPTLVGECEKAMQWLEGMARAWLVSGMFQGDASAEDTGRQIVKELVDHALAKSHARHLSAGKCKHISLKVLLLEDNSELQEAVLSVHHACIHTLSSTPAFKIIENHLGVAFIQIAQTVVVQGPPRIEVPQ